MKRTYGTLFGEACEQETTEERAYRATLEAEADGGVFAPLPLELIGNKGAEAGRKAVIAEYVRSNMLLFKEKPREERVISAAEAASSPSARSPKIAWE